MVERAEGAAKVVGDVFREVDGGVVVAVGEARDDQSAADFEERLARPGLLDGARGPEGGEKGL